MKRLIERCFTLDLRALAVMRICIALVILGDLVLRLWMMEDMHGDGGFITRAALLRGVYVPSWFCFHMITTTKWMLFGLFLVHIAATVALAVGYHTRIATFVVWLLCNSLQSRNPFILDSGDRLLLLILLWGFFCGWGRCYSWDYRKKTKPESYQVVNIGTVGLLIQFCSLYWLSAYWKWDPVWLSEATALYYAMNLDLFTRPIAKVLLPYSGLLKLTTILTMFVEIFGPLAILLDRKWLRLCGVAGLVLLHAGIFLFMSIGVFPLVSLSYLMGLLPSMMWDRKAELQKSEWTYRKSDWVPATLIALSFWWNAGQLGFPRPLPVFYACNSLKLDQYWHLFAPVPRRIDSWFIVYGRTRSGKEIDLWEPEPKELSWERPEHVTYTLRSHRDRVFGTALETSATEPIKRSYLQFKARTYNEAHPDDPLVTIRAIAMQQITELDYKWTEPTPVTLAELHFTP
jgi:hypothetical protein